MWYGFGNKFAERTANIISLMCDKKYILSRISCKNLSIFLLYDVVEISSFNYHGRMKVEWVKISLELFSSSSASTKGVFYFINLPRFIFYYAKKSLY